MSETVKTSIFAAVALVVTLGAFGSVYLAQPVGIPPEADVGKDLFPDFRDPLKGAGLEIVRADDASGNLRRFKVEQGSDGRWVIPSHGGYPADAENRLRDAATALIDLKILGVATESAGEHEMYGVIEPNAENAGKEGVGTMLAMQDKDGKDLVRLIVGRKVKGHDDQRFVRRGSQDRVYAVRFNLDAFPAKFEDWIEKDLLKLNPFDVKKLAIKDYSLPEVLDPRQGMVVRALNRRMDAAVLDDNGKWKLESLTFYRNNQADSSGLLPDEELNDPKLNDLKNGLDELKIVDVRRKPRGIGADLKADPNFLKDEEGIASLKQLGFFAIDNRATQKTDLYAANGEAIVTLKNGVEYVLKFGDTAGAEGAESGLNRYLLVTARVNEAILPKPELADLPPLPEAPKESAAEASNGADDAGAAAAKSETASDDEASAKAKDPPDAAAAKQDDRARIEAERERIAKENQRKQDEYDEKKKEAEKQVRELNYRFADWYYVVSEDVFKKIRLTRADIIREKSSAEDEGFGVDAFRNLEQEGLTKQPAGKR